MTTVTPDWAADPERVLDRLRAAAGYASAAVPGALALGLAPDLDRALARLRAGAAWDPWLRAELPAAERAAEGVRVVARLWRESAHGRADVVVADIGADSTADRGIEQLPPVREIDASEAASRLGMSARHVRRLAASGVLPARKVGREWLIDREAVDLMETV